MSIEAEGFSALTEGVKKGFQDAQHSEPVQCASLRDEFAIAAIKGIDFDWPLLHSRNPLYVRDVAVSAYEIADAMMEVRNE